MPECHLNPEERSSLLQGPPRGQSLDGRPHVLMISSWSSGREVYQVYQLTWTRIIWHLTSWRQDAPGAEYWLIFLARVPDTTPYRIIAAVLSPGCWHGALELSCESVGRKGSNPQQHQIVSFFPKMRLWDLAQLNSWWYCKGSTGFTLESCLASIWKHKIGHTLW